MFNLGLHIQQIRRIHTIFCFLDMVNFNYFTMPAWQNYEFLNLSHGVGTVTTGFTEPTAQGSWSPPGQNQEDKGALHQQKATSTTLWWYADLGQDHHQQTSSRRSLSSVEACLKICCILLQAKQVPKGTRPSRPATSQTDMIRERQCLANDPSS